MAVKDSARLVVRGRHRWLRRVAGPEGQVAVRARVQGRDIADQGSGGRCQVCAGNLCFLRVDRPAGHWRAWLVTSRLPCARVHQPQRRSQRIEQQTLAVHVGGLRAVIAHHVNYQIGRSRGVDVELAVQRKPDGKWRIAINARREVGTRRKRLRRVRRPQRQIAAAG